MSNSSPLSSVQQVIADLKWIRKFIEYARYELQPGTQQMGDQFPRQDAADKAMGLIDKAEAVLAPLPQPEWQPTVGECLDKLCGGQFDAAEQAAFLRGLADMLEGKVKPLPPAPSTREKSVQSANCVSYGDGDNAVEHTFTVRAKKGTAHGE